jgi:hypothetical protein
MKKMLGFLPFGIVLAAACSSSSSNTPTSPSGAGSGSSSGSASGSGSNSGAAGGTGQPGDMCGALNGVNCATGLHCCTNTSTLSTMCASDCPSGSLITDCTKPADCNDPAAPKCCGLHLLAASTSNDASAAGVSGGGVQCVATCPSDSVLFCTATADCPTGQTCNAAIPPTKECGAPSGDGG